MTTMVELTHSGRRRAYALHLPSGPRSTPMPLVVQLHGRGIDPVMFDRWSRFSPLADEAGFVLAMPAAVKQIWSDGRYHEMHDDAPDDVSFLEAVIDDVGRRVAIDPTRIFMVGMSNGAALAGRIACERRARVAAIAQVAGTAAIGVAAGCHPENPIPILQIHGTADQIAPYRGGQRRGLRARLMVPHPARPSMGVDDWAYRWVEVNRAAPVPETTSPAPDTTVRTWRGASPRSDVVFYRIEGGGHTWPGNRSIGLGVLFGKTSHSINATRIIWEFFAAHPRRE